MKNFEIINYFNKMIESMKYIEKKEVLLSIKSNLDNWQNITIMYNNCIRDWWLICIKIR